MSAITLTLPDVEGQLEVDKFDCLDATVARLPNRTQGGANLRGGANVARGNRGNQQGARINGRVNAGNRANGNLGVDVRAGGNRFNNNDRRDRRFRGNRGNRYGRNGVGVAVSIDGGRRTTAIFVNFTALRNLVIHYFLSVK